MDANRIKGILENISVTFPDKEQPKYYRLKNNSTIIHCMPFHESVELNIKELDKLKKDLYLSSDKKTFISREKRKIEAKFIGECFYYRTTLRINNGTGYKFKDIEYSRSIEKLIEDFSNKKIPKELFSLYVDAYLKAKIWRWLDVQKIEDNEDDMFLKLFNNDKEKVDLFFKILKSTKAYVLGKGNNWIYNGESAATSIRACFQVLADNEIIAPPTFKDGKINNDKFRKAVESKIKHSFNGKHFRTDYAQHDYLYFKGLFTQNKLLES